MLGFSGEDCSSRYILHGALEGDNVVCEQGWTGIACDEKQCASPCENGGKCIDGVCACTEGFRGESCQLASCPRQCSFNGLCVNGNCTCNKSFTGIDCSQRYVLHGFINTDGIVQCDEGIITNYYRLDR